MISVSEFKNHSCNEELNLGLFVRTARTDYLLLLEHTPVYTLGRRDDSAAIGAAMSAPNVDIFQTKRGGLLTYHGPGQLVGYPILDLGLLKVRHLWH